MEIRRICRSRICRSRSLAESFAAYKSSHKKARKKNTIELCVTHMPKTITNIYRRAWREYNVRRSLPRYLHIDASDHSHKHTHTTAATTVSESLSRYTRADRKNKIEFNVNSDYSLQIVRNQMWEYKITEHHFTTSFASLFLRFQYELNTVCSSTHLISILFYFELLVDILVHIVWDGWTKIDRDDNVYVICFSIVQRFAHEVFRL